MAGSGMPEHSTSGADPGHSLETENWKLQTGLLDFRFKIPAGHDHFASSHVFRRHVFRHMTSEYPAHAAIDREANTIEFSSEAGAIPHSGYPNLSSLVTRSVLVAHRHTSSR